MIHCVSESQARFVRDAVARRLDNVGLELHPDKTRIVYCKDSRRRGIYEEISFTFCGYTFRPRKAYNQRTGEAFTGFLPAVSSEKLTMMSRRVGSWRIHRRVNLTLDDLAPGINQVLRGWFAYFTAFYSTAVIHCVSDSQAPLRAGCGRASLRQGRVGAPPGQDEDRVLQGQQAPWGLRGDLVHVLRLHVSAPEDVQPSHACGLHELHACGRSGEADGDEPPSRIVADSPAHDPDPRRPRSSDQLAAAGLARILQRLLPDGGDPTMPAHRSPSGALGEVEVQTARAKR